MGENKKIYETDVLELCPFLQMNGLRYLRVRKDKNHSKIDNCVFVFEDEKQQGSDLSMAFLKSREKEYKVHWGFFRNELAKAQGKSYANYEILEK